MTIVVIIVVIVVNMLLCRNIMNNRLLNI